MRITNRKRLGEMLVEAGIMTEEQLMGHLPGQKQSGMKLGEYLVHNAVVKEHTILDLISGQMNILRYNSDTHPFDIAVAELVPLELVQEHLVVPVSRKGRLLYVATADPMDIDALDAVEIHTGLEVEPLICSEKEFESLCYSVYGISSDLDQVMEGVDDGGVETEDAMSATESEFTVSSLQEMADEAPVVRMVNSILSQAVRDGASDVHISPEKDYVQLRFRVDGKLREVPAPPKKYFLPIVSRLKILGNMDIATAMIPQDGRFSFNYEKREVHVRASTLPTIYGENMILRLLLRNGSGLTLDDLGMIEEDRDKLKIAVQRPYGMILSTGPTGSGKSTSLYAVLRRINQPDINIITLEDPVEYRVPKIRQVQLNKKAGMTFASGLRSILRQDPDVIMVGEIRDAETAGIAVQAALTGHRLLSTIHTNDAAGAVTRLTEMGVEPFLVASTLLVSVAQRLIRKVCPHCKEAYEPPTAALEAMGISPNGHTFYRGRGCAQCNQIGYLGRVGLFEILPIDDMVQSMIMQRASAREITRAAVKAGILRTLKEDGASKVIAGITTLEEAASAVLI
ncbi:GspE/PulE family protein [Desulfovibrio ferrophilus]|uniref:Type II secretion system protein E n=1 Tax=Desulfovibrio ferrophilus TaxID=241368 RepID=A0A2Z6AZ27_9BACT|nr:ATPase, T2SS/T4P/T4SS family [Desulfovibrio ferrophilus]BBD08521.1 type II secretion system protein E [Desulfovibrio ferrophilus]